MKLVWALRLQPETIEGLDNIPGARAKVRIFCEGLVELAKSEELKNYLKETNKENVVEEKPIGDVLHE
jgi:hypothetical protein